MRRFILLCSIATVLTDLRPGAQWVLYGEQYSGLKWLDTNQSQPTEKEVNQALIDCSNQEKLSETMQDQNLLDAKNPANTPAERIDALIKALGE